MGMQPYNEHFLFANESQWAAFVAPDKAIPILSVELSSDRPTVVPSVTGQGRGRLFAWLGEKPVSGSVELHAWPDVLGSLLKAFLTSVTSDLEGTTAYRHKFLFNDAAALGSLSVEKQYGPDQAQFARGVMITGMTIVARAKEPCLITLDLLAEDEAWNGGNWEDDVAAPANPTTPIPYASTINLPFLFHQGVVKQGGTVALTDGELVVSSGTDLAWVEACEIRVEIPHEQVFRLKQAATAGALRDAGDRIVTARCDVDWVGQGATLVQNARAGTETVLQLFFQGPLIEETYYHELVVTLPRVFPKPGDTKSPPISGDKARRTHQAAFEGLMHATHDKDFGLVIQNTETTV